MSGVTFTEFRQDPEGTAVLFAGEPADTPITDLSVRSCLTIEWQQSHSVSMLTHYNNYNHFTRDAL